MVTFCGNFENDLAFIVSSFIQNLNDASQSRLRPKNAQKKLVSGVVFVVIVIVSVIVVIVIIIVVMAIIFSAAAMTVLVTSIS